MKVCIGSLAELIDAGEWVMPGCDYNDEYAAEFRDGFFQYYPFTTETWHGKNMYTTNPCF